MARIVALLKGINVGGSRKVPMARLREVLAGLGYEDVATYVNSGNAVFSAPGRAAPATLERTIEAALEEAFGFQVPVIVRTRDELAAVVADNPLEGVADDPSRHLVLFLREAVDPATLADLDPADFAPEAFHLRGRELHLWNPEGISKSEIAKVLPGRRLGVEATGRNWRTVEKLLAMADAGAP
jgi:uncharacterized protein (DUF1697 family)